MPEAINTSRRALFSKLGKPVKAASEAPAPTPRSAPRPPRAVDELLFQRLCDGCGECQSVCPNRVIELREQLAQLSLDYGECSLCGNCVEACPSQALHPSVEININLAPNFANICNNYIGIECQRCVGACPQAAISVEDDELPTLDTTRCNGCGQCRSQCPVGAVVMGFVP